MILKMKTEIPGSEITSETDYKNRRLFLKNAAKIGLGTGVLSFQPKSVRAALNLNNSKKTSYTVKDELTSFDDATTYNNFYEFGTDKADPARKSGAFRPDPWSIEIAGEVGKPGALGLEDLIKPHKIEERVYRFRCVEAWGMVIPWVGIPLRNVLKQFEPTSKANYVAFETIVRPSEMPGQNSVLSSLKWPYVEGLRIDEAMNPLSFLAVGMYGKILPNQNGAPIRLVVPWKYGFKSIKSIVKITLTEKEPPTTWNLMAPREYGFYSNVNPKVSHPRWSQKSERRIGDYFKKPTLMFNGYSEEVANLYRGMDLKKNF